MGQWGIYTPFKPGVGDGVQENWKNNTGLWETVVLAFSCDKFLKITAEVRNGASTLLYLYHYRIPTDSALNSVLFALLANLSLHYTFRNVVSAFVGILSWIT